MIELTIPTLLQVSPAVTALTGPRIYPLVLPEEVTFPAIHYAIVGAASSPTFDTAGSQRYRVEVNCWGTSYADSVTLRAAVIQALNRYRDSSTTISYLSQNDIFEPELLQYRAMAEFYVFTNF